MGIGVFTNGPALARQLNDWQLMPEPERYTELYFANHQQFSTSAKAGDKQDIPFTVHNREQHAVTYRYTITAGKADDSEGSLLGEGVITLAHDDSETVRPTIVIPAHSARTALRVNLQYEGIAFGDSHPSPQEQAVHYWVDIHAPTGGNGS